MTVAKLREALKEKGLDTSGLKAALVERLQEALRSGGDSPRLRHPRRPRRRSRRRSGSARRAPRRRRPRRAGAGS